jgi:AcrR family transcriptional regulator
MSESVPAANPRRDPRIERTRVAVFTAALEVLGRVGYGAFTMEAVAEEARVARSTLYRHWSDRIDLIADALATLNVQPRPGPPVEGTAREQVERLLVHLADAVADSTLSDCMPALIEAAQRHPEVADFLHTYSATRRATLVAVLRAGIESGELPAHLDPELASLALSGPIFYARALTPTPFPTDRTGDLVTQVLGPPS